MKTLKFSLALLLLWFGIVLSVRALGQSTTFNGTTVVNGGNGSYMYLDFFASLVTPGLTYTFMGNGINTVDGSMAEVQVPFSGTATDIWFVGKEAAETFAVTYTLACAPNSAGCTPWGNLTAVTATPVSGGSGYVSGDVGLSICIGGDGGAGHGDGLACTTISTVVGDAITAVATTPTTQGYGYQTTAAGTPTNCALCNGGAGNTSATLAFTASTSIGGWPSVTVPGTSTTIIPLINRYQHGTGTLAFSKGDFLSVIINSGGNVLIHPWKFTRVKVTNVTW